MRTVGGQQKAGKTSKGTRPGAHWMGAVAELPAWSSPGTDCYKWVPRNTPFGTGGGDHGPPLGVLPDRAATKGKAFGEPRDPPKMAETTRPDGCHATQRGSLISLEKILTDFWLRKELKPRQRTPTMPASSCTPCHPPPNPQQRPAALQQPRKAGRRRRTKLPSYRHRTAKLKMLLKPRAGTPRAPFTL
ncbi:Hypothetical predicted protein [Pelobates cultripes]|uniref:Uncharacterized protein n=1 Tax=Pelobates cultripes TaxID=61616 RepID=A0AAD1VQD9_PELCU|nr:Hypothetical predicted protein [Pelobates cultripes]